MRVLLQLDLHSLYLMHQLVNRLLLAMDYTQHISLTHSWYRSSSLTILQTAKMGNALQKNNVIPQLKQTNKQGNKQY